jgi:hypothetical protein
MQYKMVVLRVGFDDLPSERNMDQFWSPEERPTSVGAFHNNPITSITPSDLQLDSQSKSITAKRSEKASRRPELSADAPIDPSLFRQADPSADFVHYLPSNAVDKGPNPRYKVKVLRRPLRNEDTRGPNLPTGTLIKPFLFQGIKFSADFITRLPSITKGLPRNPNQKGERIRLENKHQKSSLGKQIQASPNGPTRIEGIFDQECPRICTANKFQGPDTDEPIWEPMDKQTGREGIVDPDDPEIPEHQETYPDERLLRPRKRLAMATATESDEPQQTSKKQRQNSQQGKAVPTNTPQHGTGTSVYICECGAKLKYDRKYRSLHLQTMLHKNGLALTDAPQQGKDKADYLCECGAKLQNNGHYKIIHLQTMRHKTKLLTRQQGTEKSENVCE